ncbi:hypothetical protein [Saccharopolyspora cebuensis]|uniref:Outer membrane channel protein CpnT-like N-terminal domain-containing protein n=1 Tax=Saccharopolyspora cebuensis TaxID=418759 RepID=A0ABV4CEN3_9PSEU
MTTGLMLPPELSAVLNTLGFSWPLSDEGKLFDLAGQWSSFGERLEPAAAGADDQAQQVLSNNSGAAVEQFGTFWSDGEAPKQNLDDGAAACALMSTGLNTCAGVVLALKTTVIAQLAMLAVQIAQAIATAVPTFGASLLQIPVFRQITDLLLDQALDLAISSVLDG